MKCLPKELFVDQEYLDILLCPLGKGVLRDPMALPCQHVFCKPCIEEHLMTKSTCPTCPEKVTEEQLRPQTEIAQLIRNAPVKCLQCDWRGDYQTYLLHEKKCRPPAGFCRLGCGKMLEAAYVAQHELHCSARTIQCASCKKEISYQDQLLHDDECPAKLIQCPRQCGASFKFEDKKAHLETCPKQKSACEYSFAGCCAYPGMAPSDTVYQQHYKESMVSHLGFLCQTVSQLRRRVERLGRTPTTAGSGVIPVLIPTPGKAALDIVWNNGKKMISGSKSGGWTFFLSSKSIEKNFIAQVRINELGNDANTWKICLGLFNSDKYQVGSWERHKNGYGYILGNGQKTHVGSPEPYGEPYGLGNIISLEHRNGTITFYRNNKSQGIAYSGIKGPFYLAIALSDRAHVVEILEVLEIPQPYPAF